MEIIEIEEKELEGIENIKNGIILITGDTSSSEITREYIKKVARRFFIPKDFENKDVDVFDLDFMFEPKKFFEIFPIFSVKYFNNSYASMDKLFKTFDIKNKPLPITVLILDSKPNIYSGIVKDSFLIEEIKKSEINKKIKLFGEKW